MSRLLPRRRVEPEVAARHAAHLAGQRHAYNHQRAREAIEQARAQARDDARRAAAEQSRPDPW